MDNIEIYINREGSKVIFFGTGYVLYDTKGENIKIVSAKEYSLDVNKEKDNLYSTGYNAIPKEFYQLKKGDKISFSIYDSMSCCGIVKDLRNNSMQVEIDEETAVPCYPCQSIVAFKGPEWFHVCDIAEIKICN